MRKLVAPPADLRGANAEDIIEPPSFRFPAAYDDGVICLELKIFPGSMKRDFGVILILLLRS